MRLLLALSLVAFTISVSRADTTYVWCADGSLHKFESNGSSFVFPQNFPNVYVPVGLTVSSSGNLYVAVGGNIHVFDRNGNRLNSPPPMGLLDIVSGVAFDSADQLFCTDPFYYEICRPVLFAGTIYGLPPFGQRSQSHLAYPLSICFDGLNQMYVVNGTNGSPFTAPSQLVYTNTVQKFDTNFTFLGTVATGLEGAWGSCVDKDNNLYVSTTEDNSIRRYGTNGSVETISDNFDDWLYGPAGIAFDSLGNLVVANSQNGTVVKFAPNGTSILIASNLVSPTSIAVYPGLKLWRTPIQIVGGTVLTNGGFQFSFAANPYKTNTVLARDFDVAGSWNPIGMAIEISPGDYQFTDTQATNHFQRFYRVRSD